MKLPTPKTALGKAAYRAVLVAVVAGIGVLLKDPSVGQGGILYFALKTVLDVLNSQVPNV